MSPQKTYWHLLAARRKPTDYEIATSRLLYYTERGFEVRVPVGDWYERYQKGSPLRCEDWDRFQDPRGATYAGYTAEQTAKEVFVDGLLRSTEGTGYDEGLSPSWIRILSRVLAPMRYPVHGLQMIASYLGQMAPSGRITVTCAFQTADEIRRVQRLAYRMRQLQAAHPGFGQDSQSLWQDDPLWQPLREVVERLLVTYDWGESFVALNLVVKPMFDELAMTHFARLARQAGDDVLAKIFSSLNEDCGWHRDWSRALVRMALADHPENGSAIRTWIDLWRSRASRATAAFAPVFSEMPDRPVRPTFPEVLTAIDAFCQDYWGSAGLAAGSV